VGLFLDETFRSLLPFKIPFASRLQTVYLSETYWDVTPGVWMRRVDRHSFFYSFLKHCPALKHLFIGRISIRVDISRICEMCCKLETLDVTGCTLKPIQTAELNWPLKRIYFDYNQKVKDLNWPWIKMAKEEGIEVECSLAYYTQQLPESQEKVRRLILEGADKGMSKQA